MRVLNRSDASQRSFRSDDSNNSSGQMRAIDSDESVRRISPGPLRAHPLVPSHVPLPSYPGSPEFSNFHPAFVPGAYSPVYMYPTHGAITSSPLHPWNPLQPYVSSSWNPEDSEFTQFLRPFIPSQEFTEQFDGNKELYPYREKNADIRKIIFSGLISKENTILFSSLYLGNLMA